MGKTKSNGSAKPIRPGLNPESRENQLVSLAVDLAERQLQEGTASSQVITHFLKLASTTKQLEKVKLEHEIEMLKAKTDSLHSMKNIEALYTEAMSALREYKGQGSPVDETDDY